MSPTLAAFLRSWPFEPGLLAALGLSAGAYLRGWRILRRRDPERWSIARLAAFLGGLVTLFLALASPIEPFAALLLTIHMVQHLLLMMAVPPLIWLGAPLLPTLRGLPVAIRNVWVVPLLRARGLRRFGQQWTHPVGALPLFVISTWLWHVPRVYEAALRSSALHSLEHACFLAAALVFWYPVVRPHPARPRWSCWLLLPYLILADVSNTVLSALLTFSDRVLYPHYVAMPRIGGFSALDDQAAAGVLMWVPGSLVFLCPLFTIGVRLLFGERATVTKKPATRVVVASSPGGRPDLLEMPLVGRFLRGRHARRVLQIPLAVLAIVLIIDGLRGPQVGALNLAGVLPWVHWRGLVLLGLLAAGNISCMACPLVLPRALTNRWLPRGWRWPRWLRNKWPAVGLLALFLWAYEAFSLWDRPRWTAWIIIAYFAAAFLIDALFRGASFCKYVCPIGQFNFALAQAAPAEVKVRDPGICTTCRTRDCIRGRETIPGCALGLFAPHKAGNLDCTFCLDCVHACPHENVGILPVIPAHDLIAIGDRPRSGLGRLSRRGDIAALVLLVVYGAFANAAGMVRPVLEWQERLGAQLGLGSRVATTAVFSLLTLAFLPLLMHGTAAALARRLGRLPQRTTEVAIRFAFALVPLGLGMWLAHTSFHFFLDLGLLLSLHAAYRIALDLSPRPLLALKALAPWALLIALLFAVGIWILFQPMQMRGLLPGATG
jgi:cytochrome c oxidase assembly factor CtaG